MCFRHASLQRLRRTEREMVWRVRRVQGARKMLLMLALSLLLLLLVTLFLGGRWHGLANDESNQVTRVIKSGKSKP